MAARRDNGKAARGAASLAPCLLTACSSPAIDFSTRSSGQFSLLKGSQRGQSCTADAYLRLSPSPREGPLLSGLMGRRDPLVKERDLPSSWSNAWGLLHSHRTPCLSAHALTRFSTDNLSALPLIFSLQPRTSLLPRQTMVSSGEPGYFVFRKMFSAAQPAENGEIIGKTMISTPSPPGTSRAISMLGSPCPANTLVPPATRVLLLSVARCVLGGG